MIGDTGVGKSNILLRYIKNEFNESSKTTIGVEFSSKMIRTDDDGRIRAQIWDTAGEEKYKAVTSVYFRNACGAVVVYDVTSKISFENTEFWIKKARENSKEDLVILLIGNKVDLKD